MSESLIIRNCIAADARGARDDYCDLLVHDGRIAEITAAGAARDEDARIIESAGRHRGARPANMHEHLASAPAQLGVGGDRGREPARPGAADGRQRAPGVGAGVTTMRIRPRRVRGLRAGRWNAIAAAI